MRKKSASVKKKRLLLAASAVVIMILLFAALEITNTTHLFRKSKVPSVIPTHSNSSSSNDTAPAASTNPDQTNPSSTTSPGDTEPTATHDLIPPTGNFVSNHFPGQGGSPTTESSTCNTTAGATCYIKFTNVSTGDTTQLPSQVTDSRGSTSWYWDVNKDAHLISGQWKVTAVVTLGTQTKTADDSLKLTIQ